MINKKIMVVVASLWLALFTSQTLLDVVDAILIIGALIILYKEKSLKNIPKLFRPFWLPFFWFSIAFISLVFSVESDQPLSYLRLVDFKWIISFFALILLFDKVDDRTLIINYIMPMIAILNIGHLLVYILEKQDRAAGLLNQVMSFSHNIAPVFVFSLILFLLFYGALSVIQRKIFIFVIVTSGILTLLTITRGVWIASFVALVFGAYFISRKVFLMLLVCLTLFYSITIFNNDAVQERFSAVKSTEGGSNSLRMALLEANFKMIQDHPIIGVGMGVNKSLLPKYYAELNYGSEYLISHAHNQYVEFWANTGFIGLICYLLFIFKILECSFLNFKSTDNLFMRSLFLALFAAALCFALGGLTECNFNVSKNRYLFILLAAWTVSLAQKNKKLLCVPIN